MNTISRHIARKPFHLYLAGCALALAVGGCWEVTPNPSEAGAGGASDAEIAGRGGTSAIGGAPTGGTAASQTTGGASPDAATGGVTSTSAAEAGGAAMATGGRAPTIATGGSAPTIATGGSAPTIATGGSAPTVATGGSAPTVATGGSAPTIATGGSAPTIATGGSAPTIATGGSAPTIATGGSAPIVATAGAGPTTGGSSATAAAGAGGAATGGAEATGGSNATGGTSGVVESICSDEEGNPVSYDTSIGLVGEYAFEVSMNCDVGGYLMPLVLADPEQLTQVQAFIAAATDWYRAAILNCSDSTTQLDKNSYGLLPASQSSDLSADDFEASLSLFLMVLDRHDVLPDAVSATKKEKIKNRIKSVKTSAVKNSAAGLTKSLSEPDCIPATPAGSGG